MRLREREIKVIQIIKEHPYVTSREIADYLKLSLLFTDNRLSRHP